MHEQTRIAFKKYLDRYPILTKEKVLEMGSMDINGTLREHVPANLDYVGLDISEGRGVDRVYDGKIIPFAPQTFDRVISANHLEHDRFFWETLKEMHRVLKSGGTMFVCAPSTGQYHGYPSDYWRFQKDSWGAVAEYLGMELVDSWIEPGSQFEDNAGILLKV